MGKTYENIPHVKKAVLAINKHPTPKVPEAMELGGFTNYESK